MFAYCFVLALILFLWFFIITTDPGKYQRIRIIFFAALITLYYVGKWFLKKTARYIDTAIIIANFSFELITEILMSSFYWCNFRIFTLRYEWNKQSFVPQFFIIALIHIFGEIFQDSIRMSPGWFNWTGKYFTSINKNSNTINIKQWKVRGAIDSCIRFIIAVYSIIFISIRYPAQSFPTVDDKNIKNSAILNYSVFGIEMIYFGFLIFRPKCAGKVSDGKYLNLAEPLMRIYNANQQLFIGVFCGSMVMASLLVI